VITLVIDWIRMIASTGIGRPPIEATPALISSTPSPAPSSATPPGIVPASTWRESKSSSGEPIP
jgi:hypothetical protein